MKTLYKLSLLIIAIYSLSFGRNAQQFITISDFHLQNGKTIPLCMVGYTVYGKAATDSSNIILFPTWFAGSSASIGNVIGPNKLLDTNYYCVIAFDALGNGISSSPSNYHDGEFPEISMNDMVQAQHRVLTEKLHIQKVLAVVGGSMGSMQALEWAVSYPEFAQKIVAYVCSPKMSSHDLLWMNWAHDVIVKGLASNRPEEEIAGTLNLISAMLSTTPEDIVNTVSNDSLPSFYKSQYRAQSKVFTFSNYLAQLHAMMHHDIFIHCGGSMEKTAQLIKSKVLFILSEQDHLIRPEPALQFSKILGNRVEVINNHGGHLCIGREIKRIGGIIQSFLDEH
ncbi:MAG: alpha/beta fold hydrolase [Ignavibacteria bacterium]|nr:alpha/beta fold hydrolase [Ignavibacteria bacterium]